MNDAVNSSHSAGFSCQYLNDKLLVFLSPFFHITIHANDEFDIFCNVLDLSGLSMQWNRTECQRAEDKLNISLWSACDTNPHVWNLQSDELLHHAQDFFTGFTIIWSLLDIHQDHWWQYMLWLVLGVQANAWDIGLVAYHSHVASQDDVPHKIQRGCHNRHQIVDKAGPGERKVILSSVSFGLLWNHNKRRQVIQVLIHTCYRYPG